MVERIVLHIGTHKTGTTAIQRSLVDARDSLLLRGILYPEAGGKGVGRHRLAHEASQHGAALGQNRSDLKLLEEVRRSGVSTLVLSAEGFSNTRSTGAVEWARSLREELQAQDVHVLGYVRPQWERIVSGYAGQVKSGKAWMPFEDFLERCLTAGGHLEYPRVFGPWREAFGGRLEVRPYASELLVGSDVVTDFWQAVGLGPAPGARPDRHANRRPGARTTEMLRALRAFLADHHLDSLLPVSRVFGRARRRIEEELPGGPRFSPLTPQLVARVAERFAASNEEFVRDYLGGRHASLFAPRKDLQRQRSVWSLDDASELERRVFAGTVEWSLGQVRNGAASGREHGRLRRASGSLRRHVRFRTRLGLRD